MARFCLVLAGIAALSLFATATPRAWAFAARGGTPSGGAASATYVVSQKNVNLSPIIVYGQRIPLPVALQIVKKALKRPYSTHREDLDKLVCKFVEMQDSHLQTLRCETNRQHLRMEEATQSAIDSAGAMANSSCGLTCVIENGMVGFPGKLGAWMDQHPIHPGALKELLKKLPPADASYTLRVTDHGKVVAEYVFKDGNLVGIKEARHKH